VSGTAGDLTVDSDAAGGQEDVRPERDAAGRFVEGNTGPLRHGGEGAVKAIQLGLPMVGLAREAELAVYDELETRGRYAIVVRNASRLQATADLFWGAVEKATAEGSLPKLDRYVKRYGWLTTSALRAWAQVRAEELTSDSDALIVDAIAAAREVGQDGDGDREAD
jgi:hypothetical protein